MSSYTSTPDASPNWGIVTVTGSLAVTENALTARSILANASDASQWLTGVCLDNQQHFKMLTLLHVGFQRDSCAINLEESMSVVIFSDTEQILHHEADLFKRGEDE